MKARPSTSTPFEQRRVLCEEAGCIRKTDLSRDGDTAPAPRVPKVDPYATFRDGRD